MSEIQKKPDDQLLVTLSVADLRRIVAEEIKAAMGDGNAGELLTPEQIAERFNMPVSWFYEQSRMGKIPTHRIGRYIRFDPRQILEYLKKKD